jgi:protein-tyrosine phosphatase
MIDIHTHILPGMDDGSRNVEESLRLLEMERAQGIDQVVLTPHFYRDKEGAEHFLKRRALAFEKLQAALPEGSPKLYLGAEVLWFSSLAQYEHLDKLCMGGGSHFLLELPFERWSSRLVDKIYDLTCTTGLTPVLAHVERYVPLQSSSQINELISLGLPMQMNADSLLKFWGRGKLINMLEQGRWYIASDCHSTDKRPPRIADALKCLEHKFDKETLISFNTWAS